VNVRRAWRPAIVAALRGYTPATFRSDLVAGITVGLVAIPLAMAFGIASGVTPQAGMYTAIVGGFIVSLLGGSRVQIGGPTGAFVVIVAGIIAKHGLSGLLMVTLMAGAILIVLGVTGLGSAVKFIPRPVVIGFTNGIALLIASTQIKDFFGLRYAGNPSEFFARMSGLVSHAATFDPATTLLALGSLALVIVVPRFFPRVPGAIVALVVATAAVATLHLHVDTIGTRYGGIPSGFPPLEVPAFRPDLILELLPSALTVALLAAVESLLSAVVADTMTNDAHDSNAELIAQGVANMIVPMVGGIPVTGAIARTATNIRSGGRTPIAGIVHAATLLTVVLVFAPLAASIPLAALAAILMMVAYNMGEWREIGSIVRLDKASISVWFVTCALTIVADLTLAVEVGMSLAALLYIYRISQTTTVSLVTQEDVESGRPHILQDKDLPRYVSIVRIHGPFLVGTTDKLLERMADVSSYPPIVILRLRNMTAIDATGLHALKTLHGRLARSGRTLLLCGARNQPASFLERADFVHTIGESNIRPNIASALERARELHGADRSGS
jgi:SulP family sulfate permease